MANLVAIVEDAWRDPPLVPPDGASAGPVQARPASAVMDGTVAVACRHGWRGSPRSSSASAPAAPRSALSITISFYQFQHDIGSI